MVVGSSQANPLLYKGLRTKIALKKIWDRSWPLDNYHFINIHHIFNIWLYARR